jgi:hypothetical protein
VELMCCRTVFCIMLTSCVFQLVLFTFCFYRKRMEVVCDRTTSEMRDLSPKIISGDSQRSENAQTHTYKHIVPYIKFKLKLLQIKCHVLEFTKDEAQKMLQRILRVFVEAFISHDRHTLLAREESGPPRTTYAYGS